MSQDLTVGKRYASALFESAREKELTDRIEEELKAVVPILTEGEARSFFLHPSIGLDVKQNVLKNALEGKVSEPLYAMIRLLLERGRLSALEAVLAHYVRIANEARGKATAIAYTPFALSDEDRRKIADTFGALTGKQIEVENVLKPELLGGIQVRIGDRLYDGSLAAKLDNLKKTLA